MKSAVLASLLTFTILAQNPTPLVRSNTRVVLLDVVVADKDGKPNPDLKQENFTILENGVPQKISSFEAPVSTNSGILANSPRTIILLDELNINFADLSYARDRTLMFIRQSHWDHNLTAIMAIGRRGLTVIQDYTNDQAVLNQKLTEFRPGMTNSVEGVILQGQAEDHARQAVSGLLDIARASVGAPYNLNVIWITNGFGGAIREAKNSANGQNNGIRRLASMLTTARLRLYTINPSGSKLLEATAVATPMLSTHSGLYSGQSMSDASLEEDLASQSAVYEPDKLMQILTLMTGGRAFYGRNDIEVALKQAVSDGESNYALSYSPSNSDFKGEYRKIEVRTNVDGVHASTRRGYYAVDDDQNQSAALREERWSDALSGPLAYSAFSLTCPLTYNAESGEAKGTVTSRPTPMVIAGQQQTIQIVRAAALSSSGSILTAWSWQIDWKKTWTNRVSSVAFNKVVPRKSKAVRFVVSDPSGEHIGTCDYQLER